MIGDKRKEVYDGIMKSHEKAGEKIIIDPEELETNVFYLVSYMGDKYAFRKTEDGAIETNEVI